MLIISTLSFAQVDAQNELQSLKQRIETIDKFIPYHEKVVQQSKNLTAEIQQFEHPHLLKVEKDQLQKIATEVKKIENDLGDSHSRFYTGSLKKDLEKIEEKISERQRYVMAQDKVKKMEKLALHNFNGYSKRYVKFIQLSKEGKSTRADLLFKLLPKDEKEMAQEYEQARVFTIREAGVQDFLDESIKTEMKKVADRLTYPEQYIKTTIQHNESLAHFTKGFEKIKEDTQLEQLDFIIKESWQVGTFGCNEKNPRQFFTLNDHPGLVMLKNDEGSAIIRLPKEGEKDFEILYRCKDTGMFGICRDNQEKEQCKIIDTCQDKLAAMEASFNRLNQFEKHKDAYTANYLQENFDNFLKNFYTAYEKNSHYLSQQTFIDVYQNLKREQQTIQAKSPEDYAKKYKLINDKYQKQLMDSTLKLKGYDAKSEKARISSILMKYFFLTMQGHTDTVMKDDNLQKFAANICATSKSQDDFCLKHQSWQSEMQTFAKKTPLVNLVADECPRVVFRKSYNSQGFSTGTCGPEYSVPPIDFSPFNSDIQKILQEI